MKYFKNVGRVLNTLKCVNEMLLYEKRENIIDAQTLHYQKTKRGKTALDRFLNKEK